MMTRAYHGDMTTTRTSRTKLDNLTDRIVDDIMTRARNNGGDFKAATLAAANAARDEATSKAWGKEAANLLGVDVAVIGAELAAFATGIHADPRGYPCFDPTSEKLTLVGNLAVCECGTTFNLTKATR